MIATPVTQELGHIAQDYNRLQLLKRLTAFWAVTAGSSLGLLLFQQATGLFFPAAPKVLALVGLFGSILIVFISRRRRSNLAQLARIIEREEAGLNTLLLAALEQNADPSTGKLHFLQERVVRQAILAIHQSEWGRKTAQALFTTRCWNVFGFAIMALALALLQPLGNSRATIFSGQKDDLKITPGDAEVEKGTALAILAEFPQRAPESVELLVKSVSGIQKTIPLTRSLNDPLFGATLMDVTNDFTYSFVHDGARTKDFKIKVFEFPELLKADARIVYPTYTGMEPRKIEETKRVSAVEGSQINYAFQLNKPVKQAKLVSEDSNELVLENQADRPNVYNLSHSLKKTQKFTLMLIDEAGRTNKFPPDFLFLALTNETPKFKFATPRGDQRVSQLEEVNFQGEVEDDFGINRYGFAYTVAGQPTKTIQLGSSGKAREKKQIKQLLSLENLNAESDQLVSYYLWAEDFGPDGKPRENASDIFFAEIRPFDEIFREGSSDREDEQSRSEQQGGAPQTPTQKLVELQKQIVTATWNLKRGNKAISSQFTKDLEVISDSQKAALAQGMTLKEKVKDPKMTPIVELVEEAMREAVDRLGRSDEGLASLDPALQSEQKAYQGLLKLQAREHQVSRGQKGGGGGGGGQAQAQVDQLELKSEASRYEKETQATPPQNHEQKEELQALNRLKELAHRQEDMSGRLKELQTALDEAKTDEEKEAARRQLKRLQEEQRQIVQDMDELKQRMAQPENQSRMADAQKQLDKAREEARNSSDKIDRGEVSQALASSSRTEKDLKKLAEDFRKNTSKKFSDEMREMRRQANELQANQQKIAEGIKLSDQPRQKSLSDSGDRAKLLDQFQKQQGILTNLMENIRQVTDKAEAVEPLLARQLYETLRKTDQQNVEKTLATSAKFLERNLVPQASQLEAKAHQTIDELKAGVDLAARNVMGDETEALKLAQKELKDLVEKAERELGQGAWESNGTNNPTGSALSESTNRLPSFSSASPLQEGIKSDGDKNQSYPADPAKSASQTSPGNGKGDQSEVRQGERASKDSNGQGPSQGSGQGSDQVSQNGKQPGNAARIEGAGSRNGGQRPRTASNGGPVTSRNFYENLGNGSSAGGGGREDMEGPLTGVNYSAWSDRLRDTEEMLDDPGLRNDVARVRDQARGIRAEFKKSGILPKKELVSSLVIQPLRIIQNRLEQELARKLGNDNLTPVDRDPVPTKFADLVNNYYQELGGAQSKH